MNLSEQLNLPFPYQAYRLNYDGQIYVGTNWIIQRLNEVVDPLFWTHEILEITENLSDFTVEVSARLSIYNPDLQEWISRYQYGNKTMALQRDTDLLRPQVRLDAKKSAISDSLKKTASLFGAALDVYKNLLTPISDKHPQYYPLLNTYPFLDGKQRHQYGVPILPESYREYYVEQRWEGIFQNDLLNLQTSSKSAPTGSNRPETESSGNNNKTNQSKAGNGRSNDPQPYRIKALELPKFNPDKSATFPALMENKKTVTVIATKNLYAQINAISKDSIINCNGWYYEKSKKLTLAYGKEIKVENIA